MQAPEFDKLIKLLGGFIGHNATGLIAKTSSLTDVLGITNQVDEQCKSVLRETTTNILGLNDEGQISYLEDIMYIIDLEIPCHSNRTHSSRWESWIQHGRNELAQSETSQDIASNAHQLNSLCTRLAVRALIEHAHPLGVMFINSFHSGAEHILNNCDKDFLHTYAAAMIDSKVFYLRYELYNRYIFKGGKKLKPWALWTDEKNHYYHLTETSAYWMVRNALYDKAEPAISPPIKWLGNGIELLDLFASLAEKGYIDLPPPGEPHRISWERICKGICGLFDISGTRRKGSKTEDWVMLRQYFKETTTIKRTKETSYDRLKEDSRSFQSISPRKSPVNGPK